MSARVAVLGAGYAGTRAVQRLERELDDGDDLVWISETDYHLVLHESHRCVRDPAVQDAITLPISDLKRPSTRHVQATVAGLDASERVVELADGGEEPYDYVVVALGSRTAFYGIPGLEEHCHTLKGLDDALGIHDAVASAAEAATSDDPARIVVGGAGLSGVQTAGEVAAFRDEHDADVEVLLVEALDDVLPSGHPDLQDALARRLDERGVQVATGDPITEVTDDAIVRETGGDLPYDVLVWTGGITGQPALEDVDVEHEHARLEADDTFQTSDQRVFAIGDSALVAQDGDVAPPTAQAAWQAAEVAAENAARAVEGRSLESWTHEDLGTVVSIGDDAVAHGVKYAPGFGTFGSVPAAVLKKAIAAKWIASIDGWRRAMRAWPHL